MLESGALVPPSSSETVASIVYCPGDVKLWLVEHEPSETAIAAVFFGASQLKGRANVWGAMIALLALASGIKGLQLVPGTESFGG